MPRDLFAQNQEEGMTESPDAQTPKAGEPMESNGYHDFAIHSGDPDQNYPQALRRSKKAQRKAALHPYVQTLSIADLDSCERLERSCFPEERCIREKFLYRLTTCPDLSLGLFYTADSSSPVADTPTYPTARAPDSLSPNLKSVLIAHVISTKTTAPGVTNGSIGIPSGWQTLSIRSTLGDGDAKGHEENGRTLVIHCLAVVPSFQNQALGKTILKSYMQRMSTSGVADRIALLARDELVKYYESVGFVNNGQSEVTYGGGGLYSMVYEFRDQGPSF